MLYVSGVTPVMIKVHISLRVADVTVATHFYEAFFGVAPHKVRPGYANFDLDEPALKLALNESDFVAGRGPLDHLGFQVQSSADLDAAKQRLIEAGVATFDENDTTCCYARQDKVWVHDPDGNSWEIYLITDDLTDETVDAQAIMPIESPVASIEFRAFQRPADNAGHVPVCCHDN